MVYNNSKDLIKKLYKLKIIQNWLKISQETEKKIF